MGEARAGFGEFGNQRRFDFGQLLHVTTVLGMQNAARHGIADFITVGAHFRALVQHLAGHGVLLRHNRRGAFFLGERQGFLPAFYRQHLGNFFGEIDGSLITVFHAEHGDGGT